MTHWKKLTIEEETRGEARLFRVHGVLTSNPESYAFLEHVQDVVHEGTRRIVISLEHVDHLTSAGVGILAACYTSVNNAQGKITLVRVPERALAVLKVVHLYELLGDCADEEEGFRRVTS